MSGRAVGIDLGTSNSVVAAVIDGEAIVISDKDGRTIQPSVVSWLPDGRTVVGHAAKIRMTSDPQNTVYSVKRLVWRPHYAQEVKVASDKYAYAIVKGDDDNPRVRVQSRDYTVEEVQALILRHMKWIAEEYLGEPVTHAVITVPANFNEAQLRATKTAGQLAGLEVLRILNEPTAAALAYGYEQQLRERIAVYDLGGGTFDVTVLELRDNVLEVLSTAGDTFLGGDDFDHRMTQMQIGAGGVGPQFDDQPAAHSQFLAEFLEGHDFASPPAQLLEVVLYHEAKYTYWAPDGLCRFRGGPGQPQSHLQWIGPLASCPSTVLTVRVII